MSNVQPTIDSRKRMYRFPDVLIDQCSHSRSGAFRAQRLGQIETIKIGKLRFVTAEALDAYIANVKRLSNERGAA